MKKLGDIWAGCVIGALLLALPLLLLLTTCKYALAEPLASKPYRAQLTREAQARWGINAPVPVLAAQIEQESSWRSGVTAWDNGRGLAQFMDPTAAWVSKAYPQLGAPDPYNPAWAMRAMIQLNLHNLARVKGENACERWGAALKAYNAGLGYVLAAQRTSPLPELWFGYTEYEPTRQSQKNWEYSRMYPRWVIFKRQPGYAHWGSGVCV